MRPGTTISRLDTAPPRSAPTDTGVTFAVGVTEKGSAAAPVLVQSMGEFERKLGQWVSYSVLYDWADVYFREGGSKLYVSRVVGPNPVLAGHTFNDGGAVASIRANAKSYGDWGNSLNVAILAPDVAGFKVQVTHDTDATINETSGDLADVAAAIAWSVNSDYIDIVDAGAGGNPAVVAAQSLTGGTDDHASAGDTERAAALARCTADYGPGQVTIPGATTDASHVALLAHQDALGGQRAAVLDGVDTSTKATLKTSIANARTGHERGGAMFAPWDVAPGRLPGTTRTVPPSARICGNLGRNDGQGLSPNVPAAGDLGQAQYVIGLSQPAWSDPDRQELSDAGLNISRVVYGGVRTYGWRSLANPVTDDNWLDFGNVRLYMKIAALANSISEQFLFRELDGQGRTIAEFGGALTSMLLPFWEEGSLYGPTPRDAFNVDVGASVNTVETIANGELHAVLALRMSPYAEEVILEIVKTRITEAVA